MEKGITVLIITHGWQPRSIEFSNGQDITFALVLTTVQTKHSREIKQNRKHNPNPWATKNLSKFSKVPVRPLERSPPSERSAIVMVEIEAIVAMYAYVYVRAYHVSTMDDMPWHNAVQISISSFSTAILS